MKTSTARRVLAEMAMDFDDQPDFIDPEKKRKISAGQDPHATNAAWPRQKPARRPGAPYNRNPERPDPTANYGELVASNVYPEILRKVQRHTGRNAAQLHPAQLVQEFMASIQQACRIEAPHKAQLEQAAVRVVLELPEFKDAAQLVRDGYIQIDAKLVNPGQTHQVQGEGGEDEEEPLPGPQRKNRRMQLDPDEETDFEGADVPEIKQELDVEAGKRRFVNMLIQGAAINKNFAYNQIADELRAINPQLLSYYGKAMSIAELMYWAMPEQMINQAMGQGGAAGTEKIEFKKKPNLPDTDEDSDSASADEDENQDAGDRGEFSGPTGSEEGENEDETMCVISARAVCFPVLIQEIVKGLYEYLMHNENEPEDVRDYAHGKADTLSSEQWDIMQGPGVWRHFSHLLDQAGGYEYSSHILSHLIYLPSNEFNQAMQNILGETPEGRRMIQNLVRDFKAKAKAAEENEGNQFESMVRRVTGGA